MDVYEAIQARRSVRDFLARPIDAQIIKRIINAGLGAPSHNHLREWEFVVIQDQAARIAVYKLACYLALGYPAGESEEIKQYSVKPEEKIHWNSW
jgi:hypothetical protein